ncbi:sphingomyelin phosphodiesterase 5-like isoform X2 [Hyla sarda]|uniref:sphingomyelin phosphodiesterase 5-like isoform X2 n=1 Tax=Hyla sarda TaxID=327740 RepID=UPI0024C28497|nr:sphingomyelin phosphodiesterase 5-like isoform X2 [Hyla sarda]
MPFSESPFGCCFLDALFYLSCVLLFPSYWFIDRLLSCVVLTSVECSGVARRVLCIIFGVPLFLLLFVLSLPLLFLGLLLWAPLHQIRRPFSYQRCAMSTDPPERTITGGCSFIFVSANLCLLPDGLARFSNLSHTQRRVTAISKLLCAPPERAQENGVDSLPIYTEDILPMIERPQKVTGGGEEDCLFEVSVDFPQDPDFICLQEVFDGRASRKLRRCLGSSYPYILYDVGPTGPHCCGFKFFNSGLFLASRHPLLNAKYYIYPNGRGEDALASKGLLCVKVHLGSTEQKQSIVGYINCTHLHAPESDAAIRCDQMSLILQWVSDFQAENSQDGELVAFDVLCGDLNFDNCSSDDCLEQKHKLFSMYSDPCRDCAGRDRPGAMGTLLRQELLYHEAVNTPARLKSTLLSDSERQIYVASPLPQDESGEHWTGRRIDYIMYREADSLLPVVVDKFQFITRLAGLSDHIPVSLHMSSSLPESTAL